MYRYLLVALFACSSGGDSSEYGGTSVEERPIRVECPVSSLTMEDGYPLILDCDGEVCITVQPQFYLPEARLDVRCSRDYLLIWWIN